MSNAILGTIPVMQSLALARAAYRGSFKKKRKLKELASSGAKIMVGTSLIRATSQAVGEF